jgi:hypothetical protein
MKKFVLFILVVGLTGFSTNMFAQAKHYVIFEHFTQASCGPCAAQNPFMEATLAANIGRVHQISYHTSWPGVDPMNAYNPTQVADRVTYYSVTGVPDVIGLGNQYEGSPTGVTQALVDNFASDPAPIRVIVRETSNGIARTVKVKVFTVDTIPAATYKIRLAVLEEWIHYVTPPGTNGEKDFPDVFRKMLPSTAGDIFVPAAIGDSVTFTYTYNLDLTKWDTTQIYSMAFIQNETTKAIINSGSSIDPNWELVGIDPTFKKGTVGDVKTFHYKVYNLGGAAELFRFKLISNPLTGWSSDFTINGATQSDSVDISIPGKSTYDLVVNATIGTASGIGTYAISMKSLVNTQFATVTLNSFVMSGVNELIINNDAGWGDGSGLTTASFQQKYIDALVYSGSTAFGVVDLTTYKKAYKYDCLSDVVNYFFNVGWSFPAFTDESVAIFTSELNAGKRLLVSGQDIGWDTWTAASSGGHPTAATQAFYTNFLCAHFNADGSTANSQYIANALDPDFGQVPTSPLGYPYGSANFFPDEINAVGLGANIFYYNTAQSKIGGVKATNGTWKTVYLAASLEMITTDLSRNELIKDARIWFGGTPEGIGTNQLKTAHLGQNFPNPANDLTTVMLSAIDRDMMIEVTDLMGRTLLTVPVKTGTSQIQLSTLSLRNGLYFYRLISNGRVVDTKRMEIQR